MATDDATSAASFTEQRVIVPLPDHSCPPLAAILTTPAARPAASPPPLFQPHHCALLCHGWGSHKNGFHLPALAGFFAQRLGLASLRMDTSGNGDSPGLLRLGGFMQEVEQMAAAKCWLQQQHGLQLVLLLGHSRGAINATLHSARHGDVPLVVLVAGRFDLAANFTQRYGPGLLQQLRESGPQPQVTRRDGDGRKLHWLLTAEDVTERFALDMAAACTAIGHRRIRLPPGSSNTQKQPAPGLLLPPAVLVVHGAADAICEASDAARLAAAIPGAQLVVVEGANHWFTGRFQQLAEAVEAFAVRAWHGDGAVASDAV